MILQKRLKTRQIKASSLKNFWKNVKIRVINSIEKTSGLGDDMPLSEKIDCLKKMLKFLIFFIPFIIIFLSIGGK